MLARFAPPARRPERPPLSWRVRERWRSWLSRRRGTADAESAGLGAEAMHPLLPTIRGSSDRRG